MIGAHIVQQRGRFHWRVLHPCTDLEIPHFGFANSIGEAAQKVEDYEKAVSYIGSTTRKEIR